MDINELITIVKKKLLNQINIESINIEDKSFLHKNHKGNQEGKYHLKLIIVSQELKKMNKIESMPRRDGAGGWAACRGMASRPVIPSPPRRSGR